MSNRCAVRDGKFVDPCDTLKDAVEYGIPKGKKRGIFCWEYFSNGKMTRRFYGVKSGELVDKGIAFNLCPFCGEKIDAPFLDAEENRS